MTVRYNQTFLSKLDPHTDTTLINRVGSVICPPMNGVMTVVWKDNWKTEQVSTYDIEPAN